MKDKQNFNGNRGEVRSYAILSEHFYINTRSVDIDGADLIVEIPFEDIHEFRKFKEQGVVQAKYFEANNEVKIAKEYVHDEDGLRTNFFALLHSNDDDGENITYFFTSSQIKDNFRLRLEKKVNKEYYVFSLTKKRTFQKFRNLKPKEINQTIEEGILKTEEYSRQKLVKEIEEKFKNPFKRNFGEDNSVLHKRIKGKNIVDKLYIAINEYNKFRRITAWRLVAKLAFKEDHKTSTYYRNFKLFTNNTEIIQFFNNIVIADKISLKQKQKYLKVKNLKHKVDLIIDTLNHNLILDIVDLNENEKINIRKKDLAVCDCLQCRYNNLNFSRINYTNIPYDKVEDDLWNSLDNAFILIRIGKYEAAKKLLLKIAPKAKENKEPVIYFISKHNLRSLAWKLWDEEYPDVQYELNNLNIGNNDFEILSTLINENLTRDYSKSIDDIYLKIKEYKARTVVNDTADLVTKLYSRYAEYTNFIEGNFIEINRSDEFQIMTEKVIESFIISFSMNDTYSNHLNSLNDFIIRIILHRCEPSNLLKYFQRNNVKSIPYNSDNNYLVSSINNFLSDSNIEFLLSEIVYVENVTHNVNLRRRVERIFENMCILLTYVEFNISGLKLLSKINQFIRTLDFRIHNIALLAHPILTKPHDYDEDEILELIKILLDKELIKGYLLTNCLIALKEKGFQFSKSNDSLLKRIIKAAIKEPGYALMKGLSCILNSDQKQYLNKFLNDSLESNFNKDLYYDAIRNNCINKDVVHFRKFGEFILTMSNEIKPNFHHHFSPITGIQYRISNKLNKLVDVIFIFGSQIQNNEPILTKLVEFHDYYAFIISLLNDKIPDKFEFTWLYENQNIHLMKTIGKSKSLKSKIRTELRRKHDDKLAKMFLDYFE